LVLIKNLVFELSLVPMMGTRFREQRNSREQNNNEDPLQIIFQASNEGGWLVWWHAIKSTWRFEGDNDGC
jgi:hypothetical protein